MGKSLYTNLTLRKTTMPEKIYYPLTGFIKSGDLLYSLQESRKPDGSINFSKGVPQLCNDITIKVGKGHGSNIPDDKLEKLADHLRKAANNFLFIEFGFDPGGCDCQC